jgi:hypothetical protein
MKHLLIFAIFVSLTAMSGTELGLLPAGNGDLVSRDAVEVGFRTKAPEAAREPVSMNMAVKGDIDLNARPHVAEGRGYQLKVNVAEFNEGVALPITTPGALVRVSPASKIASDSPIDPINMVLVDERGDVFSHGRGMDMLVSDDQLRAAKKNPLNPGTSVFRTNDALGSGALTLYADGIDYNTGGEYFIDVLEKSSNVALHLQTGSDSYLQGQTVSLRADLMNGDHKMAITSAIGVLTAPDGRTFPITFKEAGSTDFVLREQSDTPGLWQVKVTVTADVDGVTVQRDARTAFAATLPTARFTGSANVERGSAGVATDLGIEVGTSGRYEVRGILFGTSADGTMKPVAVGHSANWFTPGDHLLTLSFEQALIDEAGVSAPFAIKDLRLIHQDRMGLLHRQAHGLLID